MSLLPDVVEAGAVALRRSGAVAHALARPGTYGCAVREAVGLLGHAAGYPLSLVDERLVAGFPAGSGEGTPVVLLHGCGATPTHWLVTQRALTAAGTGRIHRLQYDAWTADIPELARGLVEELEAVCEETGHERVHLVGHSLGGVVARYAVEVLGGGRRVDTAITVGSPHGGTPWADLVTFGPRPPMLRTIAQMRTGSSVLRRIEAAAARNARRRTHDVRWVALYANTDWVVPARAAQIRTGDAENVLMRDEGHISPLMSREVASTVVAHLGVEKFGHRTRPAA